MTIIIRKTLALASALLICASLQADPLPVLRAAYIEFPPMAWTDEQGKPAGYIIDLSNRLAADSGVQLEWISYPLTRIRRALQQGQIDMWPGSAQVPAMRDYTLETRPLDLSVKLCAYHLSDTPAVADISGLRDQRLILIRGYTYRDQLDPILGVGRTTHMRAPEHQAALELLLRNRGDYLITFNQPLEDALKQKPVDDLRCSKLDEWPVAYIFSRKTAGAEQLARSFEEAYERRRLAAVPTSYQDTRTE